MERNGWYSFSLDNKYRNEETTKWLTDNLGDDNWKVNAYGVLWVQGEEYAMAVKMRWE